MMPPTAWVYLNKDTARGSDEGQFWVEVIANAGQVDEAVLFTTGWHAAPRPAINEAMRWMEQNGVEPEG